MRHLGRSFAQAMGLAVGLLALGSLAIGPASAHITSVKHALSKHFEAKSTTIEFGQVRMYVDGPPVVVAAVPPFTLTANCDQPDGPGNAVRGRIIITTSEANTILEANDDEDVFGPEDNDNPEVWAQRSGGPPGGTPYLGGSSLGRAMSPSGTAIVGDTSIAINFAGYHCVFAGWVTRTNA